jgi:ATP-dependent DNA helicase RecG
VAPRSERSVTVPASDPLAAPLSVLRGLGGRRVAAFAAFGVDSVRDLLALPPRRHARYAAPTPIRDLVAGTDAVVRVRLVRKTASGRRGVAATRLVVADDTGELAAVVFGPSWLAKSFQRSESLLLRGRVETVGGSVQLKVQRFLHAEELAAGTDGASPTFAPDYELPESISARLHRRFLRAALSMVAPRLEVALPDHAAAFVRNQPAAPPTIGSWLNALHFPRDEAAVAGARRLGAFDAAVAIQWRLAQRREDRPPRRGGAIDGARAWCDEYLASWPHPATADQRIALDEQVRDLSRPRVMARLLSGDVGTGKTLVSLFPLVAAARSGRQGALLAPTELLARQHLLTLAAAARALRLPEPQLLTAGSAGGSSRGEVTAPLLVGTHCLLAESVVFRDLAAVVIDEQHKFGVAQRARLLAKGESPDLLLVSATPIPRTLAQTLFGHLDPSFLRVRPGAPRQVRTELLVGAARTSLGDRLRSEIDGGGKVFVICPRIAFDMAGTERRRPASAERVAPWVAAELAGRAEVVLLHGRLAPSVKQARLDDFAAGTTRVLVATVVVEVGLDVPDASMMVVLDADRLGRSQLHQLRGRVGRRGLPATCLLVCAEPSVEATARLAAFAAEDDGFRLAEQDLLDRGPGELFGLRQHGAAAGFYPEALLDPDLHAQARAAIEAGVCKSLLGKPFGGGPVASAEAIW